MNPFIRVFGPDDSVPVPDPVPSAPNPTPPVPPTPDPNKTFTQDELNKILAEDRRKHKGQMEKHITELETLKKSANLTTKEKEVLQQRIEEVQNQLLTKEQLLEKEKNRLATEHRTELQKEREEKDQWRNRYTESTIVRAITDSSVRADSFSPEQIVALLQPHTRLVEDVDSEGKSTGLYTPRIKFKDTDNEGKPVVLDLTVDEAVKRMKDLPDKYGNLFKSNLVSGLGGAGNQGGGDRPLDVSKIKSMSVEEYKRNRSKILKK